MQGHDDRTSIRFLQNMITDDIKEFLEQQALGFIATVNEDGTPNLSPKGTVRAWDAENLIFVDLGSPQTIANCRVRPSVAINVVDVFSRKGYRFSGQAVVVDDGDDVRKALEFYAKRDIPRDRVKRIVRIHVSTVAALISPGYDWIDSEFEMVKRWAAHWHRIGFERRFGADRLTVRRTYLEMSQRPSYDGKLPEDVVITRAQLPTLSFYRFLYSSVGEAWRWRDRMKMDDERLTAIIRHPRVEIDVLTVAGVPAGFVEFDTRHPEAVEIAYFGMMPEFIGQGLGKKFLRWAILRAWSFEPKRVWLHTCTLDHPSALPLYKQCGFSETRTEEYVFE